MRIHASSILTCVILVMATCLLTGTLFLHSPVAVLAQESNSDAFARYQLEKKDELTAFLLEAFVPIVGHAYAGDVNAGLIPAGVSAAGIVAMIVGGRIPTTARSCFLGECVETTVYSANPTVITLGLLVYLGGRTWGVISALDTVRRFNQDLERRLGIPISDASPILRYSPQGVTVGISVPLGK